DKSIKSVHLDDIESEKKSINDANIPIKRIEILRDEDINILRDIEDDLIIEVIDDNSENKQAKIYKKDEYINLYRIVHVPPARKIKVFKLLNITGAYWRGDSNNKQLQRIYGTVFEKQGQLDEYLQLLQERKERDHRKLGKELEIFTISQKVGQGLPMW